ncbi:MAG: DUF6636 domain-containing protein [Paracoccaceae bacterium]
MRAIVVFVLLLLPTPGRADVFQFSTPTRNIECSVGLEASSADIRCTIHEKNGADPRPRPADCAAPWGHHFWLDERGPVTMACGGPGRKNSASYVDIADYGVTGRFGGITCLSQRTGFQCRNADGHGFFLSRAKRTVQ